MPSCPAAHRQPRAQARTRTHTHANLHGNGGHGGRTPPLRTSASTSAFKFSTCYQPREHTAVVPVPLRQRATAMHVPDRRATGRTPPHGRRAWKRRGAWWCLVLLLTDARWSFTNRPPLSVWPRHVPHRHRGTQVRPPVRQCVLHRERKGLLQGLPARHVRHGGT